MKVRVEISVRRLSRLIYGLYTQKSFRFCICQIDEFIYLFVPAIEP